MRLVVPSSSYCRRSPMCKLRLLTILKRSLVKWRFQADWPAASWVAKTVCKACNTYVKERWADMLMCYAKIFSYCDHAPDPLGSILTLLVVSTNAPLVVCWWQTIQSMPHVETSFTYINVSEDNINHRPCRESRCQTFLQCLCCFNQSFQRHWSYANGDDPSIIRDGFIEVMLGAVLHRRYDWKS